MDVESPEFLQDPYRFYKARREGGPVHRAGPRAWTLTSYSVMDAFLAHPAAGRSPVGVSPHVPTSESNLYALMQQNPALRVLNHWMLFKNPPEHTRLRRLLLKAFTHKMVAGLEPLMRTTMRELLDAARANAVNRTFDLVSAITYPFPVRVICEMIGIPEQDRGRFSAWSQDFNIAVEVDFRRLGEADRARINCSALELEHYFHDMIGLKNKGRGDDLINRLLIGGEGDERLSEEEILANCVFLLFAGHETTASLITNGVNALLRHPDQLATLRTRPELIPNAVEECLRYDPPIQMVGRQVLENMDVKDHHFARGDHVFAFLGAAGRDPLANPEPDVFDVERSPVKQLAFAKGSHHCLGASLARLEARVAFEELFEGFPDLALAGPGARRKTWLMRGFDSLPLWFGA